MGIVVCILSWFRKSIDFCQMQKRRKRRQEPYQGFWIMFSRTQNHWRIYAKITMSILGRSRTRQRKLFINNTWSVKFQNSYVVFIKRSYHIINNVVYHLFHCVLGCRTMNLLEPPRSDASLWYQPRAP